MGVPVMTAKEAVREVKGRQGVTVDVIAERLGVHFSTVGHDLGSRTSSMGIDKAVALFGALGYELVAVPEGSRVPAGGIRICSGARDGSAE